MLSFFSMGTRVGLIFFLSAAVPLNFFRVQNLTAASPSGSPSVVTARLECIRMPQTVCDLRRPALSRPLLMLLVMPIASDVLSLIAELGRVMQHKNRTVGGDRAITRRLEVAGQNVRFADPVVREEAIGGLGIGPILADQRNALSHGASDLRQQFAEFVAKPRVPKLASTNLSINPTFTVQGSQTAFCRSIL